MPLMPLKHEPTKRSVYDLESLIEITEDLDVHDPAAMDVLRYHYQNIQVENEKFMELLVEKLQNAAITWEQPWYQESTSLTRPLRVETAVDGVTYCKETFTTIESEKIQHRWKKFTKRYNIPDQPQCFARWKNTNKSKRADQSPVQTARHFVVAYLAVGLERTLEQVYKHFVSKYAHRNRGRLSKEEEKIVEICFYHCPDRAVVYLSALLCREPRQFYSRIHNAFNGTPVSRPHLLFKPHIAAKFIKKLMKYSHCTLEELKGRRIEVPVWKKLAKTMDQSVERLQRLWCKLHACLFVKYKVKLWKLRKLLLKIMMATPSYRFWADIRWNELLKKFPDGFNVRFMRSVAYNPIKVGYQHMPPKAWETDPLYIVAGRALDRLRTEKWGRKRRLRTLILNADGELEPIQYSERISYKVDDYIKLN